MIKTPTFWDKKGVISTLLLPLSGIWWFLGHARTRLSRSTPADLPVICVGNLSAGGTGKTPVVAHLYDWCCTAGYTPAILSRGYGGSATQPLWVDAQTHDASLCGDEPLMLADGRDVIVSRDRVAGAMAIATRGLHDVILMDDGLQNPFLEKDLKIGIFDGVAGIGNGRIMPAGPLRVSLKEGLASLDIALINGEDETGLADLFPANLPTVAGRLRPDQSVISDLDDAPLLAFAGIGRPERFFTTIRKAGGNLTRGLGFADHHNYTSQDLTKLQEDAGRLGAQLITTQKDWIRLPAEWRERISFLPVALELEENTVLVDAIARVIAAKQEAG